MAPVFALEVLGSLWAFNVKAAGLQCCHELEPDATEMHARP